MSYIYNMSKSVWLVIVVDIHVINKTAKFWEVVDVIKVRQLFSKHRVSKIVSSVWWRAVQTENMLCVVL